MGQIRIYDNPFDASEHLTFKHTGPLINFLINQYPNGFGVPHTTLLGVNRLPVEDYDTEIGEKDLVSIVCVPALPAVFVAAHPIMAAIINAVISTVVALALNYAINAFFGPKGTKPNAPKAVSDVNAPSSVYSLSVPTNTVRLGQPIPVLYGRNLAMPDICSQPYGYFEDNNQYVVFLMCLGQGYFDIHGIQVAETPLSQLSFGVVEYWVFPPNVHKQTFGTIETICTEYEDVYTSPEVSDQELIALTGPNYGGTINFWNGKWDGESEEIVGIFTLDPPAVPYANHLASNKPVWMILTEDGDSNGVYSIDYIVPTNVENESEIPYIGVKGRLPEGQLFPSEGTGQVQLTIREPAPGADSAVIGPYIVGAPDMETELLWYDITFPNGCYQAGEDGKLAGFRVDIEFTAEQIDENGVVVSGGYTSTFLYTEVFSTNTPQRRTRWHHVPKARYQVSARRTTSKSERAVDQSNCYWVGLKAIMYNAIGTTVYGDTTLILFRIKASEGLSSNAHTKMAVDCTRKINGLPTRNPIDAFKDIFLNQRYGGRRPVAELDIEVLDSLWNKWDTEGKNFDAVFDQKSTVWEALGITTQLQHAAPITYGSTISIIEDYNNTIPVMKFTEENILSLTQQFLFSDGNEADGVEGEYRDFIDNSPMYVVYPENAVDPEKITLWGCRDYNQALAFVKRRWLQLKYRRQLVSFDVELEGQLLIVGSCISLIHRMLGDQLVLCIVNSVRPKDELISTVETHRYDPRVYEEI